MKKYVCHCNVRMFDKGLNAGTEADPTIIVKARGRKHAEDRAKKVLRERYSDPSTKVYGVRIDLLKEVKERI